VFTAERIGGNWLSWNCLLALIAGGLMPLAFAPYDWPL